MRTLMLIFLAHTLIGQSILSQIDVKKCGFSTDIILYKIESPLKLIIKDLENSKIKETELVFDKSNKIITKSLPFLSDHLKLTVVTKSKQETKILDFSKSDCFGMRPSKGGNESNEELKYNIEINDENFDKNKPILIVLIDKNSEIISKIFEPNPRKIGAYSVNRPVSKSICYQYTQNGQQMINILITKSE